MSWDAYEALAARDPRLGRTILADARRAASPRACAPPAAAAGLDGVSAMTAFPNYTQIPTRLPVGAWQAIRVVTLLGAIGLAMALVARRRTTACTCCGSSSSPCCRCCGSSRPGLWRNVCPLSASNQTPRVLGLSKALTRAGVAQGVRLRDRRGPVHRSSSRCASSGSTTPARRARCCCSARSSGGFVGGMLLKGKSGWCSSICPLLPIQRLYGQTPYKLVANSHCTPCVGCTKSCYDFNPKVAFLADLNDPDPYWSGYRKLFAAAFPGLVLAFFTLPEARGGSGDRVALRAARALPGRRASRSSTRSTRC